MQEFSSGISENVTWNGDQPISMGIVGLSLWIDAFFGMSFDTVNIICVFCVFQFEVGEMIVLQSIQGPCIVGQRNFRWWQWNYTDSAYFDGKNS